MEPLRAGDPPFTFPGPIRGFEIEPDRARFRALGPRRGCFPFGSSVWDRAGWLILTWGNGVESEDAFRDCECDLVDATPQTRCAFDHELQGLIDSAIRLDADPAHRLGERDDTDLAWRHLPHALSVSPDATVSFGRTVAPDAGSGATARARAYAGWLSLELTPHGEPVAEPN